MSYHKIQSVFKRDPDNNYKTFLPDFSTPEIEYLKNNEWEFTEKIDGTNIRIIYDRKPLLNNNKIQIKGKTDRATLPPYLVQDIKDMIIEDLFDFLDIPNAGMYMTLYGEGYGRKIQKKGGKYIKDKTSFILFDVSIHNAWLDRKDVNDIGLKLNIKTVPTIGRGTIDHAIMLVRNGFESRVAEESMAAEGIVLRPKFELLNKNGHRIITKLKTIDYV